MGRKKLREVLFPALTVMVLLCAWQAAVTFFRLPQYLVPAPSVVAVALVDNIDVISSHARTTLIQFWGGFATGALGGLALAVAMTLMPSIRTSIYPLVIASQTIPKIAIAPLIVLWFGVGVGPKIGIVALLAFFPVLINSIAGFDNTNKGQLDLMRSVSATNFQVYRHIRIPAAIPYIFAGLKLGLTVSVIGAIVAEWVGAQRGLGYLLILYNSSMRTPELFAVLVVLVSLAAGTFLLLLAVEQRFSWAARLARAATTSVLNDPGTPVEKDSKAVPGLDASRRQASADRA
jgi:ABC-type nitrate/sulfonate/bicarbonate transport system permease component